MYGTGTRIECEREKGESKDSIHIVAIPRRNIKFNSDSYLASETINLSTEIKNIGNSKDTTICIDILEASLLSKQWRFTDSVKALKCNNTLSLHEKLHLILRGKRYKDSLSERKIEWSSLKISKSQPESQSNVNVAPYSKFVVDYPSPFEGELEALDQDDGKIKQGLIQSMLVVRWKALIKVADFTRTAIGQHYTWLECFNTKLFNIEVNNMTDVPSLKFDQDYNTDTYNTSEEKYKGGTVMFRLQHTQNVDHNFKTRKLCLVPVDIHIVNCYGVPVKTTIDMSKRESSSDVNWVGALSSSMECGVEVSLGPFEARRVPVSAVCASPARLQAQVRRRHPMSVGAREELEFCPALSYAMYYF
ncbi:hypothetical protein EVAR_70210_1 [Eumeta japonica]|uniref:Uncharacterized protein n=1 Tax=Eumeta variegata TaxID=151549 RepID=A0A4C1SWB2_EUMVA|nr:hypothetical protein EVAR_70210_1 [Eumeta japonica]